MTAMYGVLAAIPMVWGYAGYVMVSHPGTAEADAPSGLRKLMPRAGKGVSAAVAAPGSHLRLELELLEAAQDSGERPHRGQPAAQAALQRADVGHDDVASPAIAPLCGLIDDF